MMAPGFCRLHRPPDEKVKDKVLTHALQIVREETAFRFDLLVLFDEKRHTEAQLRRSVQERYGFQRKVIVIDTTGPDRTHIARRVMAAIDNPNGIHTDVLVERTEDWEAALDWSCRLVTTPYFLVCKAGHRLSGIDALGHHLDTFLSRVVRWSFPVVRETTLMVASRSIESLWITQAYRLLSGSRGSSVFDTLAEYEQHTGWSLSWFFDRAVIA
jgi:hypothetical protein